MIKIEKFQSRDSVPWSILVELPNGMRFFKYSWPKTRVWLSAKVEALSCGLKREGVYAGTGSKSATLGRSSKQSNVSKGTIGISTIK